MPMIDRIKAICLKPNAEWPVIEAETTSTRDLMLGYVAPLAAITPIAGFVGGVFIGRTIPFIGTYHVPLTTGLTLAVVTYVLSLVGVYVLSLIISALAPELRRPEEQRAGAEGRRLCLHAGLGGGRPHRLHLAGILAIIASFYGLYVLYLGLPVLMKNPKEKSFGYTIVIVICAIVLWVVIGAVGAAVGGAGMLARGGLAGLPHARAERHRRGPFSSTRTASSAHAGDGAGGAREQQEDGRGQEERRPQRAGPGRDAGAGRLFGGGKRVDPIGIDQLKPFVPTTFAGIDKTGGSAEKNGMAGLAVSKAEGTYSDRAKKHVTLGITDTGGASGLIGLAGWMNMQGEREDDSGFEKTDKVDGRLTHEKGSKRPGGSNEFTVVLGDRFIVAAPRHRRRAPRAQGGRGGPRPRQARSAEVGRRSEVTDNPRRAPPAGPARAFTGRGRPRAAGGSRRRRGRRQSAPAPCSARRRPRARPGARLLRMPARSRKPRRASPARCTNPFARTSAGPRPSITASSGSASSGSVSVKAIAASWPCACACRRRARRAARPDVEQPGAERGRRLVARREAGALGGRVAARELAVQRHHGLGRGEIQLGQEDPVGRLDLRARLLVPRELPPARLRVDGADDARRHRRRGIAEIFQPERIDQGSAMPVVSSSTTSGFERRVTSAIAAHSSDCTRTSWQTQPPASSITSPARLLMRRVSMSMRPSSLMMTPTRRRSCRPSTRFSVVVLPAPRKPVSTTSGGFGLSSADTVAL